MRFIKLEVEAFQGVGRAELEFGPGLNVLYGENDLGKSTLASAVRAALLVVPKSSEAANYVSWYADEPPRVTLTFCDDENHFWQVKKVFARSTSAELFHSKDGVRFTLDCKAREVEDKLREILRWGIPSPGGKGAPRGLPESFLANTLLASQTDVDAILQRSLEGDGDVSGKLRLQHALATLAQDPLFKRVLDAAQREFDSYFTETGRRRRTQGSKLVAADDAVKRHQRECDELRVKSTESLDIEEHVRKCRALREDCMGRVADAQGALANAQAGLANAKARADIEAQVAAARGALAEVDAHAEQVRALRLEIDALAQNVNMREAELAQAQAQVDAAAVQLQTAEEELRRRTGEQAEQSRRLRRAELESKAAKLREQRMQLESQRELARRAADCVSASAKAREAFAAAELEQKRLSRERAKLHDDLQRMASETDLARAVLAYTRWQATATRATEAADAEQNAGRQRVLADEKASEAAGLEARAQRDSALVGERRAILPTSQQLEQLKRSQHSLEIAEAKLGGGLSVLVRPRKPIALSTTVDQDATKDAQVAEARSFEAERSLRLRIADLVDIEITAGAADQRQVVEHARAQWRNECMPVLEKAGAPTVKALEQAVAAVDDEEHAARDLLRQAEKLRGEASGLRERGDLLEQQAKRMAIEPNELAARRAAIGIISLEAVEDTWRRLGKPNEPAAETAYEQQAKRQVEVSAGLGKLEQDSHLSEHVRRSAEINMQQSALQAETAVRAIGDAQPDEYARAVELQLTRCTDQQAITDTALAALDVEVSDARSQAEQALVGARTALETRRVERQTAQQLAEAERTKLHTRTGELAARQQAFERLNRPAALARVQAREQDLANAPATPLATEHEAAAALVAFNRMERELAEADQAFYKAEGALTKVGGAQLGEQLQQAQEALEAAKGREREIEIDADAWKLLRHSLKQAEDSEAAHLGRALGGPVGQRFAELTRQRYSNLEFDPLLSAAGLQATGVSVENGVLAALSAGTRDQLATLVRLTIAHQLRSAIILDDHLVQTDPVRLEWFREMLLKTALETQVVVLTCRPADYLRADEIPRTAPSCDLAGGSIRAINLGAVVRRWDGVSARRR